MNTFPVWTRWRRATRHALLAMAVTLAMAANSALAEPIRRIGQNPRGLALGGTGLSYADDEMAMFYNPAGLAGADSFWIELLPLMLEASPDGQEFIEDKLASSDTDLASLSGCATDGGGDPALRRPGPACLPPGHI